MQALREAAIGTVAELIKVEYPRFVKNKSMYTNMDYKLHTWMTRMKGLQQAIKQNNKNSLRTRSGVLKLSFLDHLIFARHSYRVHFKTKKRLKY